MIKRITSNGMYMIFVSFLLTFIAFKYDTNPVPVGGEAKDNLMFTLVLSYVFIWFADMLMLSHFRLTHISKFEITITLIIATLFMIQMYVTNLSFHWFIWLYLAQFSYRIINHFQMEAKKLQGSSYDVRNDLNIKDNFVVVKGSIKKYKISIRTNTKDDIFFDEHNVTYRNKKLKINMLKQIQADFKKDIVDFTDDELILAEMYSF